MAWVKQPAAEFGAGYDIGQEGCSKAHSTLFFFFFLCLLELGVLQNTVADAHAEGGRSLCLMTSLDLPTLRSASDKHS